MRTYREPTMIDIREVLRRWQAGQSGRQIDRETGVDHKTVARYVHWANQFDLPKDRKLCDEEIHEVAQCVQARPEGGRSREWQEVAQHQERIEQWLSRKRPREGAG